MNPVFSRATGALPWTRRSRGKGEIHVRYLDGRFEDCIHHRAYPTSRWAAAGDFDPAPMPLPIVEIRHAPPVH